MPKSLFRRILISLVFAFIVYIGFALWSDWRALSAALTDFPVRLIPIAIVLTLVNYVGRALKWYWYLRLLKVPISLAESARIFAVGMLMVMTPGKAGEFLKSFMVKNAVGTPISQTAPIVLAERLTDGIAMLILASAGLFAFADNRARIAAAVVFTGFLIGVTIVQIRPLALWFISLAEKLPLVKRIAHTFRELYESSYILFSPRWLIPSILWGVISWLAESIAYLVVLSGFGVEMNLQSLLISTFIFSISSVFGALLATPGGLGAAEGSLVALAEELLHLPAAPATAAALVIRFCTLWFGVVIGVISFLLWPNLMAGAGEETKENAPKRDGAVGERL